MSISIPVPRPLEIAWEWIGDQGEKIHNKMVKEPQEKHWAEFQEAVTQFNSQANELLSKAISKYITVKLAKEISKTNLKIWEFLNSLPNSENVEKDLKKIKSDTLISIWALALMIWISFVSYDAIPADTNEIKKEISLLGLFVINGSGLCAIVLSIKMSYESWLKSSWIWNALNDSQANNLKNKQIALGWISMMTESINSINKIWNPDRNQDDDSTLLLDPPMRTKTEIRAIIEQS